MGLFGALGGALTAGKSQTALKTINKLLGKGDNNLPVDNTHKHSSNSSQKTGGTTPAAWDNEPGRPNPADAIPTLAPETPSLDNGQYQNEFMKNRGLASMEKIPQVQIGAEGSIVGAPTSVPGNVDDKGIQSLY